MYICVYMCAYNIYICVIYILSVFNINVSDRERNKDKQKWRDTEK